MSTQRSLIGTVSHFVHEKFLLLLLGAYALAAFCPAIGLSIRGICFAEVTLFGERAKFTLPAVMLMLLLVNAGLGVDTSELRNMGKGLAVLCTGLVVNLAVPVLFIFAMALLLRSWHNPDDVQNLLVGLAMIAAMPVAGSSTAWSQNANGNIPLSLGMVIASTFLSPVTTPVALHSVGQMATGEHAAILHSLAFNNTGSFLMLFVLAPSLVGMTLRAGVGKANITKAKPGLKLLNSVNLLLLNYSNASASLPKVVAEPAFDVIGLMLAVVVALCVMCFLSGWLVAYFLKTDRAQKASLMFGLGMNNNGTGLVLASLALANHHEILLPILLYNLVQHLMAGGVDYLLCRGEQTVAQPIPVTLVVMPLPQSEHSLPKAA
jgi:BASS family bile acid:Na+ symporter